MTGGAGQAGAATEPVPEIIPDPVDAATYIFDDTQVRTYNILVAPADLALIDQNPYAEQLVPASLEFEGKSYGPYKVRYKGSVGAFLYPCTSGALGGPKTGKCSLKLDFNDLDDNARFYGLKKLNFHSLNADVSMLRDRLGYRMFREMGVAAPRAVHARVLINGELVGLFGVVEQIDGRFTRARFSEGGEGNLYKEIWPRYDDAASYLAALETNESEQPQVGTMLAFKGAIASGAAAAAMFIDRDYLLRLLAVDRVIINDDGFLHFWCDPIAMGNNHGTAGNHNYYWYEAERASRLWLIPWDLDNSFDNTKLVHIEPAWTATAPVCECVSYSEFPTQAASSCEPLIQHMISWLPEYEQRVDAFLRGPFAKDHVDGLLDTWVDQIRAGVGEASGLQRAPTEAQWAEAVMKLRATIESARANRGYRYP